MRYAIIKNCTYVKFELWRDQIDYETPWALFSARYSKHLKQAVFGFWDSDYIPEGLRKYIQKPPKKPSLREKLARQLEDLEEGTNFDFLDKKWNSLGDDEKGAWELYHVIKYLRGILKGEN